MLGYNLQIKNQAENEKEGGGKSVVGFIIGLFTGGLIGAAAMALCIGAARADEYMEKLKYKEQGLKHDKK